MAQGTERRPKRKITPEIILAAYDNGYFPMAHGPQGAIEFCAFDPRGIVPLDERFTVRRSLRQILRKHQFEVTLNTHFREVIMGCSRHNQLPEDEIWLSDEMIELYVELHQRGIAHSVEVWEASELVGGLYGLALGSAFCGESMFSTRPHASQVALVHLVEHLRERGFTLLDAQMSSDHLKQFGLFEVSHDEYIQLLREAQKITASF